MGNTLREICAESGDFDQIGPDGPTFVVDYVDLSRAQLLELREHGITHGTAFTAVENRDGTADPVGPTSRIEWIECPINIKEDSIQINNNNGNSLNFIYSGRNYCNLTLDVIGYNKEGPIELKPGVNQICDFEFSQSGIGRASLVNICIQEENSLMNNKYLITYDLINRKVVKYIYEMNNKSYQLFSLYGGIDDHNNGEGNNSNNNNNREMSCVICLGDDCDTAVLPCRHMCLCHDCARSLVSGGSKCPICRKVIQAFLKV